MIQKIPLVALVFMAIYARMFWGVYNKEDMQQRVTLAYHLIIEQCLVQGHCHSRVGGRPDNGRAPL